jgi:aconitate hydratase
MLPLTLVNPDDYDKIKEDDKIELDIKNLTPDKEVTMKVKHSDGSVDTVMLNHTLNEQQIEWFKAGSALNLLSKKKS